MKSVELSFNPLLMPMQRSCSSSLPNLQHVKPSPLWEQHHIPPGRVFWSKISDNLGFSSWEQDGQTRQGQESLRQVKGWWQSTAPCKAQSEAAGEGRHKRTLKAGKRRIFFPHHTTCYRGEVMNVHMFNSINSQREKSIKGH